MRRCPTTAPWSSLMHRASIVASQHRVPAAASPDGVRVLNRRNRLSQMRRCVACRCSETGHTVGVPPDEHARAAAASPASFLAVVRPDQVVTAIFVTNLSRSCRAPSCAGRGLRPPDMSFVGTIDDAKDPTMLLYAIHEISHTARPGHRGCWPGGSHKRGSARPERFADTPMSAASLPRVPGPGSCSFKWYGKRM